MPGLRALYFLFKNESTYVLTDETIRHALEVSARDGTVFVEVDTLKVCAHFAEPKIRHFCDGLLQKRFGDISSVYSIKKLYNVDTILT